MCGIALNLSGVHIEGHLGADGGSPVEQKDSQFEGPSLADICEGLKRRGPDIINIETLNLTAVQSSTDLQSVANVENSVHVRAQVQSVADLVVQEKRDEPTSTKIQFVGALLSLRGDSPVSQPLRDTAGNILIYNGEIFGGLRVQPGENDTLVLMTALATCCACDCHASLSNIPCACSTRDTTGVHKTVPKILSALRGPWALVYWQAKHQLLWFGRDVLGRRSLLLHRPSLSDPRLLLASVAPAGSTALTGRNEDVHAFQYWEELQCGIHSLTLKSENPVGTSSSFKGLTRQHVWEDPLLLKLVLWDRQYADPSNLTEALLLTAPQQGKETTADSVLKALRHSMERRTSNIRRPQQELVRSSSEDLCLGEDNAYTPVAVLFSGGLDSMILAALLDECLQPDYGIDLLNVSFETSTAPDRISAIAGLAELRRLSPSRRWRLVKVDADLTSMDSYRSHLQSLICPSNTFMDLNIGTALWLAARGEGYLHDTQERLEPIRLEDEDSRTKYRSSARVLLVGAGADEQCGGYGRHRTKYRLGGWAALQAEMRIDMQRIWKRNLGRDDRCMADLGKEARFPFLDEEVVDTLLDKPLWEIVDLRLPIGNGDKRVLREVAMSLGLPGAATLPKRAIQFGSRIARESNKREFGSNRAANQASAGSALLSGIVRLA
ncbi:uncharacterized protein [Physcomitrium patens]|uniref:Glutamine amidotransferase type-2 domain-containing protein n=2 Tax=Physcomitrium patens TaxID=3218 RepID=A0A2K1JKU7_PHYPA|nr:asparagine synthetase domain-containing protein 1-like isoform X1 [Physcomitrium patens]PNR42172.1 hypothetical protein PHYPA_017001 [Physcomitrium patens]|eukprot:XP_024393279.1 asparagine synthetase domain-containing protein 1-like isoform X1 [Physcomitrella patens]